MIINPAFRVTQYSSHSLQRREIVEKHTKKQEIGVYTNANNALYPYIVKVSFVYQQKTNFPLSQQHIKGRANNIE